MSSIEKLLNKFILKPESVKYRQLIKILRYFGFEKIYTPSSHVKFKHSNYKYDIYIPVHNKECKDVYKKNVQKIIKEIIKTNGRKTLNKD